MHQNSCWQSMFYVFGEKFIIFHALNIGFILYSPYRVPRKRKCNSNRLNLIRGAFSEDWMAVVDNMGIFLLDNQQWNMIYDNAF